MILVGYGYWGRILYRIFQNDIDCICDINPSLNQQTYKKFYKNTQDCIANNTKQKIAIIANSASNHYKTAKLLLENDYDLWIEKPVSLKLSEIDDLIQIAEKRSRIVLVDHTYCYDENINKLKHIGFGDMLYYRSIRLANGPIRQDISSLYDLAIHDLSILDFLFPTLQIKSSNVHEINKDHVILELLFNNNLKAAIECSWSFPIKKRLIIAKGTKTTAIHDSVYENILKVYDENLNEKETFISNSETLLNVKDHFLQCIETRQLPKTNLYNARKIMSWLNDSVL